MATGITPSEFTLTLTEDERTLLLSFLEQALREKAIEVHRTDSLDYRKYVQHQEDLLRGLIEKMRQA